MLLYYGILYLFSFEYCITESQIITTAKHNKGKLWWANENLKQKRANSLKRGKTRVTKSWLV